MGGGHYCAYGHPHIQTQALNVQFGMLKVY
jgi:hypothetical protein